MGRELNNVLRRFPSKADAIARLDDGSEMFRLSCSDYLGVTDRLDDGLRPGTSSATEGLLLRRKLGLLEAELRGMIEDHELA